MIGRTAYGACAVAMIATTAVMAQPTTGSSVSQTSANKQVCRTFGDTGSRLGRYRACHTVQEWIELRRQTKQNVDHIQNARPWNVGE